MYFRRDYSQKLKVGIVGVGGHSYKNILPAIHYLPYDLKAVCDVNEDLAKVTAEEFGCRYYVNTADMYEKEDLDAVMICVSPRLHPKLACEALNAGLNVWMEKPPAMRAIDIEKMIECRKDKVCMVGYKKALMPVTDKALEIINSQEYGNLKTILGIYPMSIPNNGKDVLESGETINWLLNGVHPLSFILAVGGKVSSVAVHSNDNGNGALIINFSNGVVGNLHLASGPLPMECYNLYGDKWHMDIVNNNKVSLYRDYGMLNKKSFIGGEQTGALVWEAQNCLATLENKSLFTQGFISELELFADCVLNNKKLERCNLEFALQMMKVYEAALLSNGKVIDIL